MERFSLREFFLDLLLPRFCLGCGREGLYICETCEVFLSEVNPAGPLELSFTRSVETKFQRTLATLSVWEYEGVIEKAIWKIKYGGCFDVTNEIVEKAFEKIELRLPQDTVITYVPMYKKKERQRGFNQARLIAEAMGKKTARPVVGLLQKTKDNLSQVGLGPKERKENVRGVFGLLETWFPIGNQVSNNRSVLLVDDVYTTGATIGECMRVLKKAGVKNVWGFTIARKMNI